jgi:hypothetical protein
MNELLEYLEKTDDFIVKENFVKFYDYWKSEFIALAERFGASYEFVDEFAGYYGVRITAKLLK